MALEVPVPAGMDVGAQLDGTPVLVWARRLPGAAPASAARAEPAGPVLHGERIFVGQSGESALFVLDRRDGALLHRLPTGAPVACAPVVSGDFLYVSDAAGYTAAYRLDALDLATPAWKHFGGAPIVSTPVVSGGRVVVTNVAEQVVSLDAATGELVWRHEHPLDASRGTALELYGAPGVAVDAARGEVLAGFSDGFLVALGAADGSPRWSASVGSGEYPDLIAPALPVPAAAGGAVIAGGYTGPLVALDPETRDVRWRIETGSAAPLTLLAADGAPANGGGSATIFHGSTDGKLRRIDARTGEVRWIWDSGQGSPLGAPVPTARGLLVADSGGTVHLVDPELGTVTWRLDPGVTLDGVTAPLAVEGDTVYVVSNAGVLYALRGAGPAPQKRPPEPYTSRR
jgi:outer membrane protein assembly factor BamB